MAEFSSVEYRTDPQLARLKRIPQPLYIAAEKGQLPELKRFIVGFGDRIAMEETLDGALARVFGGESPRAVSVL